MPILPAWRTFAMVIGPAPGSPIVGTARWLAQPYLTFFGLQNSSHPMWARYHFSYVIEDTAGEKHTLRWPND
jgi:hypothetical protein